MTSFLKDPGAKLDYGWDWERWLGNDTLDTSTWTVPTGLTKVSDSKTTKITIVWLSGGTIGQEYTVTNHIKTASGREDERSFTIAIVER